MITLKYGYNDQHNTLIVVKNGQCCIKINIVPKLANKPQGQSEK